MFYVLYKIGHISHLLNISHNNNYSISQNCNIELCELKYNDVP